MDTNQEANQILGIGNLHHFIFLDGAKRKQHVVFFITVVKDQKSFGCDLRYMALTLKEYKAAKRAITKLPSDTTTLNIGELTLTGKSRKISIINDGYLETIKITNSVIKRSLNRGSKLSDNINEMFVGNSDNLIVRYHGVHPCGARQVLHIGSPSPFYSVVYYPENENIGLYDQSLNSKNAFPTISVVVAKSDNYDELLRSMCPECKDVIRVSFLRKIWCFIKRKIWCFIKRFFL